MNKSHFCATLFSVVALGSASVATGALAAGHGGGGGHGDGGGHHGGGHYGGHSAGGGHYGGHFGGGHFGYHHFGRPFFIPFNNDEDWSGYGDNDCWQSERVPTSMGSQWRRVWICD